MQTAEGAVLTEGAVLADSAMAPDAARLSDDPYPAPNQGSGPVPAIRRFVAAKPIHAALAAAVVGGLAAALLQAQVRKQGPLLPKLRALKRRR